MADAVDTLVAEIRTVVDVTDAEALVLLNRRHRQMVARGQSYRDRVFDPTVADQADYTLDDASGRPVIEVHLLGVDGEPYARGQRADAANYELGLLSFTGPGLFLAFGNVVKLVPTPTEAGLQIEAFCSMLPPDLVAGGAASTIRVDQDLFDALVDGAVATQLSRIGEGDPASLEAKFAGACEELRVRVRRRYRGPGVTMIRLNA